MFIKNRDIKSTTDGYEQPEPTKITQKQMQDIHVVINKITIPQRTVNMYSQLLTNLFSFVYC